MKKLVALLLALAMVACLFAGCASNDKETTTETPTETTTESTSEPTETSETTESTGDEGTVDPSMKVAFVTDVGNIDDHSFNQYTYEGITTFADENSIDCTYYKPAEDTDQARIDAINQAIADGYNTVVMAGYLFGPATAACAAEHPEINFLALDVSAGDLGTDTIPSNVSLIVYKEEQAGYLAGYAAVKAGYTELGFLGGMAVPAVVRYGYGFVQGVDAAAAALGLTDVKLNYVYGGQFYGDADITAVMDTWYANGTEVVFACGGGIFASAAEAAAKVGGKVIGVDVDQAAIIDAYAEGMTVTSAMKGLAPTVKAILGELILNDNWAQYAGQINTLGLVSGTDVEANYVQIPYESTQWSDTFTKDDYAALVAAMFDGTITVSNDTETEPTVQTITVDYQGNIK